MKDFNLDIEKVIFENPKSFLEKLRESAIIPFNEFEQWKDIYHFFRIWFINREDIQNPPKDYFKVFLYHTNPEKTRKNLIENYEAINSSYYNLYMHVPVKYFEKLIDESFSQEQFNFVHLSELCYQENIKWDLRLFRKFKKLTSEAHNHACLNINPKTKGKLSFKIVEEFKNEINWGSIIHFKELKWTLHKLLKYKNYIKFTDHLEYSSTGEYREIGFSLNLKTDWNANIIEALSDYWNWSELCLNRHINWDISLINTFIEKVDFEALSSNSYLKWDTELIETYKDKWDWQTISGNPALPWSLKLLKKYDSNWKWNVRYNWYTDSGSEGQEVDTNYDPSISTNPGIIWNLQMLNFGKKRLDIWRLARRGNLNLEVVKKIKKELYKKEHTGWVHHEYSDFMTVTEKIYLTGWENLAKNTLFKLSPEVVDFIKNNKIQLTYSVGNLAGHGGGRYVTSTFRLIQIFKNSTFINVDYIKQVIGDDNLKSFFINNDFINDEIWEKILAPYILKNKKWVLEKFKKIVESSVAIPVTKTPKSRVDNGK